MTLRLHINDHNFEAEFQALLNSERGTDTDVRSVVADIIADVEATGDTALINYTKKFDRFDMTAESMRVNPEAIKAAKEEVAPKTMAALKLASDRISAFHSKQKPNDIDYRDDAGVRLGERWTPISAAGLYVPGGLASYPSSVLMNAIAAKVAGVARLVMAVPSPDGILNPLVLAAADLAGVDEIYTVGGAQAIAALSFGTETIAAVDKIVGPGNAYVAEAKRQVFGRVGIDTIAGPSEILVVADGESNPEWVAADLLSQAEHDSIAQAILITFDDAFAVKVEEALMAQLDGLPRADIARESWQKHGAILVVESADQAAALIDRIAPEHLELSISDPDSLMGVVKHAGAIFLGRHTPEAIGDYVAGTNHVLPTSRAARFAGGLSVYDFMKRTTFVGCDTESLALIGPAAVLLAEEEGLHAHARSVSMRLDDGK